MSLEAQMEWERLDLSSADLRSSALETLRATAPADGLGARFFNVEWKLGPDPDWTKLRAYVLRDGEAIVGLAPFFSQDRPLKFHFGEVAVASVRLRRFSLIGDVHLALGDDPHRQAAAVDALLDEMVAELGSQEAIYFEGLPINGPTHRRLVGRGGHSGHYLTIQLGEAFDHQFITLPDSFKEYVQHMGSRSRQSVQYSQRRLERDMEGQVRIKKFEGPQAVEEFVADASAISRKTYQWHLLGLGLRHDEQTIRSLRFAAEREWLRSYVLYCRGTPCAFMLGYSYGNCYYYDDVGYDPEYAKWSVGTVLQLKVLEELLSAEPRPAFFDFSTGFGEHKGRFGNLARPEVNVLVLRRTFRSMMVARSYRVFSVIASSVIGVLARAGVKGRLKKLVRRLRSQ